MDSPPNNNLINQLQGFLQQMDILMFQRGPLINTLDSSTLTSEQFGKFNQLIANQVGLMKEFRMKLVDSMINQLSLRDEIYDFEINNICSLYSSIEVNADKNHLVQQKRKVSKLLWKFMSIKYDFTETQMKAVQIYNNMPLNPKPNDEDFQLFSRIIKKHLDFHSFTLTFKLSLQIYLLQMLVLLKSINLNHQNHLNDIYQLNELMKIVSRFQIWDIILKYGQLNLQNQRHMAECLFFLSILINFTSILILELKITSHSLRLHNYSNNSSEEQQFYKFAKQNQDKLGAKSIDFIVFLLKVVVSQGLRRQQFTKSISCVASIIKIFKPRQIYDLDSQEISFQNIQIGPQIKKILYLIPNHQVIFQIIKSFDLQNMTQFQIKDVFIIFQLISIQVQLTYIKQNYSRLLNIFVFHSNIVKLCHWALKFIFLNKGKGDPEDFYQIFIESQFMAKVLKRMDDEIENLDTYSGSQYSSFYRSDSKIYQFVLQTILSVEICRISQIHPYKIMLSSAEKILNLNLGSKWMNQFLLNFLEDNPQQENQKMEIQE